MALGQEEVGKQIRRARDEADFTQPELAHRIGLKHPQSISNYERGRTDIPPRRLRAIAEATRKPMAFFLGGEENPTVEEAAEDEAAWSRVEARLRRIEEALGIPPGEPGEPQPGQAANGH